MRIQLRPSDPETGPQARMRKLLLETAIEILDNGGNLTVSKLAETAEISRATAYRYFPNQSALAEAIVEKSLDPILDWEPKTDEVAERVEELFSSTYPRLEEFEAPLRAVLMASLQQWLEQRQSKSKTDEHITRGYRKQLLMLAVAPAEGLLGAERTELLKQSLSIIYGPEVFLVLKDIWGLELDEIVNICLWIAKAIIKQAELEAKAEQAASASDHDMLGK